MTLEGKTAEHSTVTDGHAFPLFRFCTGLMKQAHLRWFLEQCPTPSSQMHILHSHRMMRA